MPGGSPAQDVLADEGQIAVRRILAGGEAGPLHHFRIGRYIGIEVVQPEEIATGGIGKRAHTVNADTGDVLKASGTRMLHDLNDTS